MIPLPSEYITKRASQFSECLFFVPSWIYARRGQKCWLQRCNWKILCRSRASSDIVEQERQNHPLSHYSINNKSDRIQLPCFLCSKLRRCRSDGKRRNYCLVFIVLEKEMMSLRNPKETCMVEPNLGCLTPYFLRRVYDISYLQLLTVIKLLKFYSLWVFNPLKIEFFLSQTLRFHKFTTLC